MKKTLLIFTVIFSTAIFFTACKETKKEEVKTEITDEHIHENENVATKSVYQCPMDCEKGKTYKEAGICPVCNMDLKANIDNSDSEHMAGCKCLEGGACKCEEGKCECKKEMALQKKDGKMCAPGKCQCKA